MSLMNVGLKGLMTGRNLITAAFAGSAVGLAACGGGGGTSRQNPGPAVSRYDIEADNYEYNCSGLGLYSIDPYGVQTARYGKCSEFFDEYLYVPDTLGELEYHNSYPQTCEVIRLWEEPLICDPCTQTLTINGKTGQEIGSRVVTGGLWCELNAPVWK
jgi:hypothetical protein